MTRIISELVEGEMDDEDNLNVVFNRVLAQFVNSRQPSFMQTNESVVRNWKDYLRLSESPFRKLAEVYFRSKGTDLPTSNSRFRT